MIPISTGLIQIVTVRPQINKASVETKNKLVGVFLETILLFRVSS